MARRPNSLSRAHRQRLTPQRKLAFLEALRIHGVATRAAREASPNAKGTSAMRTFRDERARAPEFAAAWDEAIEAHHGDLVVELYRRATVGDQVPIQNAKGEVLGWRSIRSDALLLAAVRAHCSAFTPRTQTEAVVEQTVTARVSNESLRLEELTPDERRKLREVLESSLARRNGSEPSSNGNAPSPGLSIPERER
jgi:hypothetical protein